MPFRRVELRSCRPTFVRNVQRSSRLASDVVGGPRTPAFSGAVTFAIPRDLLKHMDGIFFGLLDTRAGSSVSTLTRGVSPVLARRTGGVLLGRGLFTHIGSMCRARQRLAPRRLVLLRGGCSKFVHDKTGLSPRSGRGFHRLDGRLDRLALRFSRGGLGRAGGFRLRLARRGRLSNLPRSTVRTTTLTTGRGRLRN